MKDDVILRGRITSINVAPALFPGDRRVMTTTVVLESTENTDGAHMRDILARMSEIRIRKLNLVRVNLSVTCPVGHTRTHSFATEVTGEDVINRQRELELEQCPECGLFPDEED